MKSTVKILLCLTVISLFAFAGLGYAANTEEEFLKEYKAAYEKLLKENPELAQTFHEVATEAIQKGEIQIDSDREKVVENMGKDSSKEIGNKEGLVRGSEYKGGISGPVDLKVGKGKPEISDFKVGPNFEKFERENPRDIRERAALKAMTETTSASIATDELSAAEQAAAEEAAAKEAAEKEAAEKEAAAKAAEEAAAKEAAAKEAAEKEAAAKAAEEAAAKEAAAKEAAAKEAAEKAAEEAAAKEAAEKEAAEKEGGEKDPPPEEPKK